MNNATKQAMRKAALRWAADAAEHGDHLCATIAEIAAGLRPGGQTLYGYYTPTEALECVADWEAEREREREAEACAYEANWHMLDDR